MLRNKNVVYTTKETIDTGLVIQNVVYFLK